MNSEEKFKESLNDLLGSVEFSFTKSDWEAASKLIDDKRRKRRLAFYFLLGLLILTSGLSTFFILDTKESKSLISVSNGSLKSKAVKEVLGSAKEIKVEQKDASTTKAINEIPKANNQSSKKELEKKTENISKEHTKQSSSEKVKEIKANSSHAVVSKVSTQTGGQNSVNAGITKDAKTNKSLVEEVNNKSIVETWSERNTKPVESEKSDFSDSKQENAEVITQPKAANEIGAKKAEATKRNAVNEHLTQTNPSSQAPQNVPPSITDSSLVKNNHLENKTNLVEKVDSASIPYPYDVSGNKNQKTRIAFEAGAAYFTGWKNATDRDANGFSPLAGINYFNWLNQNTFVSIGLQYYQVGNLNASSYTSKTTRYSLGEESQVTVYTPGKLQYLSVPVKYNIDLNSNNTFGFGFNLAYLFQVESKVESYRERLNARENYTVSKTKGYLEGFSTFDTQLAAIYRRKIYKNISISAEAFFGLTDIKDNTFFKTKLTERNKGLKVTLVYSIFKKH